MRPPLANIDQAVVVTACVQPDFSTNLLDRQLVALEEKQIKPIIYFTKGDLVEEKQQPIFEESCWLPQNWYEVYLDWQAFNGDAINNLTGDFADQLTILWVKLAPENQPCLTILIRI